MFNSDRENRNNEVRVLEFCTYQIISLELPQLHPQLKSQVVVCSDGWQSQQPVNCFKLSSAHVVQSNLIFKQLGKPQDVFIAGLLSFPTNLVQLVIIKECNMLKMLNATIQMCLPSHSCVNFATWDKDNNKMTIVLFVSLSTTAN